MSVRRAQQEISSAEFAEWMAYAAVEPFGPIRDDQRAGIVASILANVNRDSSEHPEPFTVDEFLPRYEGVDVAPPLPDDTKLENKLKAWALAMNDGAKKEQGSQMRPKKKD